MAGEPITKLHQGVLLIGKSIDLTRTFLGEELCLKQARKKERTIPLVLFSLDSSSLLSLDHLYSRLSGQPQTEAWPELFGDGCRRWFRACFHISIEAASDLDIWRLSLCDQAEG
uniref:Uncharacterized protein n=1 Tax=Salix viminalis TaxID=40686 RepID=A0A6N2JX85_SALVM